MNWETGEGRAGQRRGDNHKSSDRLAVRRLCKFVPADKWGSICTMPTTHRDRGGARRASGTNKRNERGGSQGCDWEKWVCLAKGGAEACLYKCHLCFLFFSSDFVWFLWYFLLLHVFFFFGFYFFIFCWFHLVLLLLFFWVVRLARHDDDKVHIKKYLPLPFVILCRVKRIYLFAERALHSQLGRQEK